MEGQPNPVIDEDLFVIEEVTKIIKEGIEGTIGGNFYAHSKVRNYITGLSKLQHGNTDISYLIFQAPVAWWGLISS